MARLVSVLNGRSFLLLFLLVATVFVVQGSAVGSGISSQVIEIDSCQELNVANAVYVLTASITDHSGEGFVVVAENVTLDGGGNTVDGVGNYYGLASVNNPKTIVKNTIFTNWGDGILFDGVDNGIIQNVTSNNASSCGFYIIDSENVIINDTITNNNDIGIVLEQCWNGTVENAIANNNADTGIWGFDYYNVTIRDVTTNNNAYGIVWEDVESLIIDNASVNFNEEYGIWGGDTYRREGNYTIKNSLLNGNSYGFYLDYYVTGGVIFYDSIINNSKGIVFGNPYGYCVDNLFYNNLISNIGDNVYWEASIGRNYWNTTKQLGTRIFGSGDMIGGNFWSNYTVEGYSYTCCDVDDDDFCDFPLVLSTNNIDYLPLSYEEIVCDSDGDGLTDEEEVVGWDVNAYACDGTLLSIGHVTSDQNIADEDSDGLNDYEEKQGWHVSYMWNSFLVEYDVSSHPRLADVDNDGKSDLEERIAGTDPNKTDTDCDEAWDTNDGFEIDHGMNPLSSDTDNDGITDGEEIDMWIEVAGYDPTQPELVPSVILDYAIAGTTSPNIPAAINTDPDTLNLKSNGEWITAYIELPEGYDLNDIEVSTVMINSTISVDLSAPTNIGDYDLDGVVDLMVKFDRASIIEWLGAIDFSEETGKSLLTTVTITGNVLDVPFEGSDTMKVLRR